MTSTISCSGPISSSAPEPNGWLQAIAKTYFACCFLAFAAIILGARQPPLFMDYPDWVYQGVLFGKLLAGHPISGYALKHYPVPNTFTTVGLGLFTLVFGWFLAAKLWVIFYLGIACATSFYAAGVLRVREAAFWWLLPGVLFFSRGYWLGTINFDLGVCAFLLLVCALYRRTGTKTLTGLLVFCFFAHFIAYAAALLIVLLHYLQHGSRKQLFAAAATLPLPLWYVFGRSLANTDENALGASPTSHLLPMLLAAFTILLIGWAWPRLRMLKVLVPVLYCVSALVALASAATLLWNAVRGSAETPWAFILLQDKIFAPLGFGFVNMLDLSAMTTAQAPVGQGMARYVFLASLVCVGATGVLIVIAGVKALRATRNGTDGNQEELAFLWHFSALMTLLYFLCPPNALGVVGIDLRLAELALGTMLFLLARDTRTLLRWSVGPAVLFTCVNLYQFTAWQKGLPLPATLAGLPPPLARCCNIDPLVRLREYDHLKSNKLDDPIFPTGIFVGIAHPGDAPVVK